MKIEGTADAWTVVTHLGVAVEVERGDGERRRVRVARKSGVVVGDVAHLTGERGEERLTPLPRRTELRRRAPSGGAHVVAANLDVLCIVAAVDPPAKVGLLDRAAVAARAAGIAPAVVINKVDLPEATRIAHDVQSRVSTDTAVLCVSAATGDGMEALAAFLATAGRAAFIGPSGVGKSSLLNRLLPAAALPVSALSDATGAGRHTTTTSTLHRLPGGGEIVDTPGVREFGLVDVTPAELSLYFPGFEVVEGACRFRDCRHEEEPACAVRAAVQAGTVPEARYVSYLTLLHELSR
jgi:ribosome biogenesis GTPase